MKYLVTGFAKITGAIPMWVYYRPKVFYSSKQAKRSINEVRKKGKAVVVSNHISVYDYILMLLLFPFRFVRVLMAEVLFKERGKFLAWFLRNMGGIYVDRNSHDLSFMTEAIKILNKGGLVGIFPEARLVKSGEVAPFSLSAISIALKSGAPIIPIYHVPRGKPFRRVKVMVGEAINLNDLCASIDPTVAELKEVSCKLRDRIEQLKEQLSSCTQIKQAEIKQAEDKEDYVPLYYQPKSVK